MMILSFEGDRSLRLENGDKPFQDIVYDEVWNAFLFMTAARRHIDRSRLIASNNALGVCAGAL